MPTHYLTTAEVAMVLKISRVRVNALIRAGKLKAEKFGKAWMIAPASLANVRIRITGWPKGRKRGTPSAIHRAKTSASRAAAWARRKEEKSYGNLILQEKENAE